MTKKAKNNWQEGDYFVQKILNSRFNSQKKCMEYKVKWVGYPMDQCTWQPHQHLQNVQDLIDKFMKEKRKNLKEGKLLGIQKQSEQQIEQESLKHKQSQNIEISAKNYSQKPKLKQIQKPKVGSLATHKKDKKLTTNQTFKQQDNLGHHQQLSPKRNINNQFQNQEMEIQKYITNNVSSIDRLPDQQQLPLTQNIFFKQQKTTPHFKNIEKTNQLSKESFNSFQQPGITATTTEDSFEILGMSRNKMDLLFHVCQNGAQKWVNRSQIIDKRAKQICEFYQQNLVFLRDQNEKSMID